jgi:hypothetical protein
VADEVWETLLRFHREIFRPDLRGVLEASEKRLVAEMNRLSAGLHRRFDRLEQIGREHRQEPAGR